MPFATIALVGTVGAVSTGASGAAVTPAWGTGESRTANNLLVLQVAVTGSATVPTTPSGWSSAVTRAGTTCSVGTFYKVAAGADAAPTVVAITSGIINARLSEYSGADPTSPFVSSGANSGITSPLVATNGAADPATGSLMVSTVAHLKSSAGAITTQTDTYTNGTAIQTSNKATSTVSHYDFCYATTTAFASADSDSLAYTTTTTTGVAVALASFKPATVSTGTWTLKNHVGARGAGGGGAFTSTAIDTTGADLIVISLSTNSGGGGAATLSDSKSNTWLVAKDNSSTGNQFNSCVMYYCHAPTVGTGHTFTATGTGFYGSICVEAWQGSVASPIDQTNANSGNLTVVQPGSITPGQNGELVIAVVGDNSGGATINSGFSISDDVPTTGSVSIGTAMAYLVQSTASAVNPTWTDTQTMYNTLIVSFKPGAAAPPSVAMSATAGMTVLGTTSGTGPAPITRAAGFIQEGGNSSSGSPTSEAVTWATVGDLAILQALTYHNDTAQITAVSSTKVSGWTQVVRGTQTYAPSSVNLTASIWIGTITAAGADTINVTWNANPTQYEVVMDELTAGLGVSTTWAVVTSGALNSLNALNYLYPSLTSGASGSQAYWGYAGADSSGTSSSAGFTYVLTPFAGGEIALNGSLSPSTVYQPSGVNFNTTDGACTVAMIVSATTTGGPATVTGAATLAATAGMTVGASVKQLASVTLAGGAALNVQAVLTRLGVAPLAATAGMTVGALVTEVAGVSLAATAGMTVVGTTIGVGAGAANLAATAGLTVGASVTDVASVSLAAIAGMTVAGTRTQFGSVPLAASAGMTVGALVTEFAAVNLVGSASLSVSTLVTELAGVSLAATAGMTVTGTVTAAGTGAVFLAATAGLTVAGSATTFASVSLAAGASLTVSSAIIEFAAVSMAATASLSPAGLIGQFGVVPLSATASLTAVGSIAGGTSALLSATAGLTVDGVVQVQAVLALTGSGSLVLAAQVTRLAAVVLAAVASMSVGVATVTAEVVMASVAGLVVDGIIPGQQTSLVDQINAVIREDPQLLGAKGYMNDVASTRLWGRT